MLQKKEKIFIKSRRTTPFKEKILMSTQLDNAAYDDSYFQHHLPQIYRSVLKDFKKITQSYVYFHIFFATLLAIEVGSFVFLSGRAFIALGLGALLVTGFSYLVLYFYYQARKPERLLHLKETFLGACKRHISIPQGEVQHHLSIADALLKLASYLDDYEEHETPSLSNFFWKDIFLFKRFLLDAACSEHLQQIRVTPTDLEVHASMAASFVAQSKLYRIYGKIKKIEAQCEKHFKENARLAMEEFQILNHYAPNDPWIHEQLALGFKELEMPEEELKEVELLVKLRPQDKDTLFLLGILYFRQGMNAKGLQIYEELKESNFKKAEELISSYGSIR